MSVKSVVDEASLLTYQKNERGVGNLLSRQPAPGVRVWGGLGWSAVSPLLYYFHEAGISDIRGQLLPHFWALLAQVNVDPR